MQEPKSRWHVRKNERKIAGLNKLQLWAKIKVQVWRWGIRVKSRVAWRVSYGSSSMKILSTFFQVAFLSPFVLAFHTRSLSSQYSSSSPTLEGTQYLSRVSGSVSAINHLGRCGGIFPSSLALLVALCFSSCFDFNPFAYSYLPNSNARWSGRSLQSVGQMKGLSVSS